MTIPSSLAELTIPTDSLRKLPRGAVYTKKSGNIRVMASIKGDSLYVIAETENTPGLNYTEEESLAHTRNQLSRSEAAKEPVISSFWNRLKHGLIGISITIFLIIILKTYRKWKIKQHPSGSGRPCSLT